MASLRKLLPRALFVKGKKHINWRKKKYDIGPDNDEELHHTPIENVKMLGFDPKHVKKEN